MACISKWMSLGCVEGVWSLNILFDSKTLPIKITEITIKKKKENHKYLTYYQSSPAYRHA